MHQIIFIFVQQIKRCQRKGISIKATADLLGMSRNKVKKYLHLGETPRHKTFLQVNIALFDVYIWVRIKEKPKIKLIQLCREIKQRGLGGGRTSAFVHLHCKLKVTKFSPPPLSSCASFAESSA